MSGNETKIELTEEQQIAQKERESLEARATTLGITFHPNIKNETLAERIAEKLKEMKAAEEAEAQAKVEAGGAVAAAEENEVTRRNKERKEQLMAMTRLVRVKITCHDPSKQDIPGEVFTVGNGLVGSLRKFIPYNTDDNGYHMPYFMYLELKERTFTRLSTEVHPVTKQESVKRRHVKMFALELLPQLDEKEIGELAKAQAAAGIIE